MPGLPPVFIEFLGSSKGVKTAMADVKAELATADASGAGAFKRTGMLGKAAIAGIGIAALAVAAQTAHMAADFQTQMTRVQTGAGEAAGNMKMVGDGVLAMAGRVGESTSDLTKGLYTVESAGYHGAAGLNVLENAAMGAKVGAADLQTVTDAVTTGLNAYKMGASQAATVTNELVATESEGKTNMEALAGSMATILPTASAAHVGIQEVLGAMATMTAQGTPAAVAATYLRQTIGMLSNPSAKAAAEMKDLGLSAIRVGQNLGKNGLASTLTMLTDAIQRKMGPAGTVLIKHLQDAAKHTSAYQKVLANLPPAQQTYVGALATMVGGTKSMQAALELTGPHMKDFQANTRGIATHVAEAHGKVEGWAEVQKTFNQRMAEAKAGVGAMGIQIGNYLLPALTQVAGVLARGVTWLTQHKETAKAAAIIIGGVLVFALAAVTAQLYAMAAAAAVNPVTWIILGVMAVIAALVMLALHWRTVWAFIKTAASAVARAVGAAWDWVASHTVAIWHDITSAVSSAWHAVAAFFVSAWHLVADPIVGAWHWVVTTTMEVWNSIIAFFRKWWPLLLVIFLPAVALVMAIWNHFHAQIIGTTMAVWHAVASFFTTIWNWIASTASAAWALIRTYVVAPMTAAWHDIVGIWNAVTRWLATEWAAVAHGAAIVWAHIRSAIIDPITGAWHDLVGLAARITLAMTGMVTRAWNAVTSFMSHWYQVGVDIIQGIINGVTGSAGSLFNSMKGIAEGALKSAKDFLGIASPSKEAHKIGAFVGDGLVGGLEGSAAQVKAAARRIAEMLYSQFGPDRHVGLQRLVKLDGQELNRLAAQRTAVAARLKGANANLAALQKDWASTQASVASSIMQSVTAVTAPSDGSSSVTVDQVLGSMRAQVQRAQAFASQLQQAQKNGLSAAEVQQIAAAGVDQGGATAAALSTATKGQIQQINQLQASAKSAAGSAGAAVADSMYKAGIQSAQGLVRGLKSQEAAIQHQMDRIARGMADAIRRALKIHSPSQVAAEIGDFFAQGLGVGLVGGAHHAVTAAAALAGAVTTAGMPAIPRLGALGTAGGAGGMAGGGPVVLQITNVLELDGDVVFRNVQEKALVFDRRNSQAGLVYRKS